MTVRDEILEAAMNGDLEKLHQLAKEGADFNSTNDNGEPILSEYFDEINSIEKLEIHREVAATLIALGANPNFVPKGAACPLFISVINMDLQLLEILIAAGADPNKPESGEYPESLLDVARFDYYYEVYDCLDYPEESTEEDRKDSDTWFAYLDRIAIKYEKRRPDYLLYLRSKGAKTSEELGWHNEVA